MQLVCVLPAYQRPLDESTCSSFDFATYIIAWIEFRARQFGIWACHRSMAWRLVTYPGSNPMQPCHGRSGSQILLGRAHMCMKIPGHCWARTPQPGLADVS